jgi:hypothetical protein
MLLDHSNVCPLCVPDVAIRDNFLFHSNPRRGLLL